MRDWIDLFDKEITPQCNDITPSVVVISEEEKRQLAILAEAADYFLAEAKMVTDHRTSPFAIWKGPGKMDIAQLAVHRDLRGVVSGPDVFVWYAAMGTHHMAAEMLGLKNCYQFYITAESYDRMAADGQSEWQQHGRLIAKIGGCNVYIERATDACLECPAFKRMLGGDRAEMV